MIDGITEVLYCDHDMTFAIDVICASILHVDLDCH